MTSGVGALRLDSPRARLTKPLQLSCTMGSELQGLRHKHDVCDSETLSVVPPSSRLNKHGFEGLLPGDLEKNGNVAEMGCEVQHKFIIFRTRHQPRLQKLVSLCLHIFKL